MTGSISALTISSCLIPLASMLIFMTINRAVNIPVCQQNFPGFVCHGLIISGAGFRQWERSSGSHMSPASSEALQSTLSSSNESPSFEEVFPACQIKMSIFGGKKDSDHL